MKAPHVHYSKSQDAIESMKRIKQLYDPKGILSALFSLPATSFCTLHLSSD